MGSCFLISGFRLLTPLPWSLIPGGCRLLFGRLERQAHRERASLARAGAGCFYLPAMLRYDAVADGQAKACALAGPAAREERLEDVFQNLLIHAAACVGEHQLGLAIALPDRDGQLAVLVPAVQ